MTNQSLRPDDGIEEVMHLYADMVYRLAFAHVKRRHDADDIFQEVFLRYISKPRTFDSEEHRKAFLLRCTIDRCKSLWATAWLRRTAPLSDTLLADAPANQEESDLREYLRLLPQKYRAVVHLFYGEDLSIRHISEMLGARESTIRTWLTRARRILGEKLKGGFLYE